MLRFGKVAAVLGCALCLLGALVVLARPAGAQLPAEGVALERAPAGLAAQGARLRVQLSGPITPTATLVCVPITPTRVATPAFTPGPGCSGTPGPNVLDATITISGTTSQAVIINHSSTCSYPIGLAV